METDSYETHEFKGNRYDLWMVLTDEVKRKGPYKKQAWCRCDCGNEKWVRIDNLKAKTKSPKSCGCHNNKMTSERNLKPILPKYSKLTPIIPHQIKKSGKYNNRTILCKCDCGQSEDRYYRITSLRSGESKSCGCVQLEKAKSPILEKYGRLTPIIPHQIDRTKKTNHILCSCSCGKSPPRYYSLQSLRRGYTKSCGCFLSESVSSRMSLDLGGQVFNDFKVLKFSDTQNKQGCVWDVECLKCGSNHLFTSGQLRNGSVSCCGGRVYRIINDAGVTIYIGQTTNSLSYRLNDHVKNKNSIIRKYIKKTNSQVQIEEITQTENQNDLLTLEREYIKNFNGPLLNHNHNNWFLRNSKESWVKIPDNHIESSPHNISISNPSFIKDPENGYVYGIYNGSVLIYIGQTQFLDLNDRLYQHLHDNGVVKKYYDYTGANLSIRLLDKTHLDKLLELEKAIIIEHEDIPLLNQVHSKNRYILPDQKVSFY